MAICKRQDAVNYNEEGDCLFLVRRPSPGLVLDSERIMHTELMLTGQTYVGIISGTPIEGDKVIIVLKLHNTDYTYSSSYVVQAGDTVRDVVDGLAAAVEDDWLTLFSQVTTGDAGGPCTINVQGSVAPTPSSTPIIYGRITFESNNYECHAFEEVIPENKGLTMSWYPDTGNWMFFHSYSPNIYFRDKVDCYCIDTNTFYRMNKGTVRGIKTGTAQPFIIDLVFKWKEEVIIDHVLWESAMANSPFTTFSHITVSTREFSTGRIALTSPRRVQGIFAFNKLRDVVITLPFKDDVYNNFDVLGSAINANLAWFKKGLLEDNYCIVRLEYDGTDNIVFLGADTFQQQAYR